MVTLAQGNREETEWSRRCYSGFNFSHYESPFPTRDFIRYVRSGLYQLVIRVKGIRVCALHCVREVPSFSHCFRSFRLGRHAFSELSLVSLAHGPRWLFLLSRHRKAFLLLLIRCLFVNKDLCTRKSMKRTIKWWEPNALLRLVNLKSQAILVGS